MNNKIYSKKNKIFFSKNSFDYSCNKKKRWYVIQVYSGYENLVKDKIKELINVYKIKNLFGRVLVPIEKIIEIKKGKKCKSERKVFPGYILIEMKMNEKSWHLIRHIPKVNGFVGGKEYPTPITIKESSDILEFFKKKKISCHKPKTEFNIGQVVRVLDGPFVDFTGVVKEINYDKSRLQVAVSIFGRSTPVELEFSQVEKDI